MGGDFRTSVQAVNHDALSQKFLKFSTNIVVCLTFITHSVHILSKTNRTESYEEDSFNMCLNFSSL
jgi:hypothetical protein